MKEEWPPGPSMNFRPLSFTPFFQEIGTLKVRGEGAPRARSSLSAWARHKILEQGLRSAGRLRAALDTVRSIAVNRSLPGNVWGASGNVQGVTGEPSQSTAVASRAPLFRPAPRSPPQPPPFPKCIDPPSRVH